MLAELALDHSIDEIAAVRAAFVEQFESRGAEGDPEILGDGVAFAGVGRFPARVKCALLPWNAANQAIQNARAIRDDLSLSVDPESNDPMRGSRP